MEMRRFAIVDWLITYDSLNVPQEDTAALIVRTVEWVKTHALMCNEEEGRAMVRVNLDSPEWNDLMKTAVWKDLPRDFLNILEDARENEAIFAYVKWET